MKIPSYCPKCGNTQIIGYGCSRWGFRRYGGKLNPKSEPVPCRRNDVHHHWYCCGIAPVTTGRLFTGCGHRWVTT